MTFARCLLAVALFAGCTEPSPPSDAGPAGLDAAPCGECEPIPFFVEVDGEPLTDGRVVDWEYGFQGGTMIVPTVVFEGGVTAGETVDVDLWHDPDPADPGAFGQVENFRGPGTQRLDVRSEGGRLVAGPINDQLGWSELDGIRLVHRVEVRDLPGQRAGSRSASIEMASTGAFACEGFAVESGDCVRRQIPGEAFVALGEPDGTRQTCEGARRVTLDFLPDDPGAAAACAGSREVRIDQVDFTVGIGIDPPASCLEAVGLTDGATVRATVLVPEGVGCAPVSVRLGVDASSCDEMCF